MLITQRGSLTEKLYDPEHPQPNPLESQVGFVERTSDPRTYFYTKANKHNDYQRDFDVERTQMVSGVPAIGNLQDRAMTELMSNAKGEVIYDRSREHLGSLDIMCIAVRRTVIRAAKALRDHGILPANVDNVELDTVRPVTVVLPEGADWVAETAPLRDGKSGAKPAHEIKPMGYLDLVPQKKEHEIEVVAGGGA
jgi:phthalate 4,5-dioxygenase